MEACDRDIEGEVPPVSPHEAPGYFCLENGANACPRVKLPKSFLAVNLSESHTFHKKEDVDEGMSTIAEMEAKKNEQKNVEAAEVTLNGDATTTETPSAGSEAAPGRTTASAEAVDS